MTTDHKKGTDPDGWQSRDLDDIIEDLKRLIDELELLQRETSNRIRDMLKELK